jgi:hypothetical protein
VTEHDAPDPIATAQNLTGALGKLATQVKALNDRLRRTRHMVWGLVISLVLDLFLTAGFAAVAVQARNTQQSNLALCLSSNHARHQQISLWGYVLSLGGPPKTAEQRKVIAEFETHLHKIYAPRNCSHLSPGKP